MWHEATAARSRLLCKQIHQVHPRTASGHPNSECTIMEMFNSKQIIWGCWRQWGFWHKYPQSECDVTRAVIFSSYMDTAGCSPAGACLCFFYRGVLWKLSHRLDPPLLTHADSVRYKHVSLIKRLYRGNLVCECVNPFFISRVLTASSTATDNRTTRQPDFAAKHSKM